MTDWMTQWNTLWPDFAGTQTLIGGDPPGVRLEGLVRLASSLEVGAYVTFLRGEERVEARIAALSGEGSARRCQLALSNPIPFGGSQRQFLLLQGEETLGAGVIERRLEDEDYDRRNIRWTAGRVTREEREAITGHSGLVVWLTGLSGSGKSTIAQMVERKLLEQGIPAFLLDGDQLRRGLTSDLGFTREDRLENQRRVAETAALFCQAGLVTLVSTISPYQSCRDYARSRAEGRFLEVYVKADLATCMERDPKQLYQKATAGGIDNFTGLGSGYEVPEKPDLVLDTRHLSREQGTELLCTAILSALNRSGSSG